MFGPSWHYNLFLLLNLFLRKLIRWKLALFEFCDSASLKGILVEHEGLTRILKHFNLTLRFRSANILWHKKVEVNELKYFSF